MEKYDDFIKVYNMLEDDLSKRVFLSRAMHAMSGERKFLLNMIKDSYSEIGYYINSANDMLLKLCMRLQDTQKKSKVAVFGTGGGAVTVIQLLYEYGMLENKNVECFFIDNNKEKQGKIYKHHNPAMCLPVYGLEALDGADENLYIVIATNTWIYTEQIYHQLMDLGISADNIVYSIKGYDYNIGNIYFEKGIMVPKTGDVFCDIGAYDMWNTGEFMKWCPDYGHVYAFEADPISYEHCKENVENQQLKNTDIYNYGIWSCESEISFLSAPNGEYGGSRIDNGGTTKVKTVAIDEFLKDKKVSIIKMDIEGAELEALKGAKTIIKEQRPSLTISVYHKKWDILELPLYIKSLNPRYKLYMRHHTFGIWDTVLYAVDGEQVIE